MLLPRAYLETSFISYLASRPSRDVIVTAHQHLTRLWWRERRQAFDLYISQFVLDEAGAGDPSAVERRLIALEGLPLLEVNEEVLALAEAFLNRKLMPPQAEVDALHLAVSTVHRMDYLLTWNCKHLANAEIRLDVERVCRSQGYNSPVICTPEELLGV